MASSMNQHCVERVDSLSLQMTQASLFKIKIFQTVI